MSSNKRGNIFGQGKPERPYEERDDPADVPQRATAAQLATRKIKTAKVRRPAGGASPSLSQSVNFSAPQQSTDFNFGASAPAPSDNGASTFGFGGSNAFGGGAVTNSFPPAQSSAPSNTFTSSSFPAFGASTQGTGFNPQPPATGFNFTAGNSNPFAASSPAPAMNGNPPAPAFGGSSSLFNAQPQSNLFGSLGQNNNTSAAPSGGMFGTSSGAPPTNMFGTISSAPDTTSTPAPASQPFTFGAPSSSAPDITSTPAPASQPFTFGAPSSSAQNNASTPAKSNLFSFGASAQASTPAPNNLFGGFGSTPQKNEGAAETATPQNNMFGGFGTSAQGNESATATAPASNLFNFGPTTQKSDHASSSAPSTNLFGTSSSAPPTASTPASAPASNPFAKLPTATNTTSSPFSFPSPQTPQAQDKASISNNLFSSLKPVEQSNSTPAETPKPNLFASLAMPSGTPAATPAASTPGFSMFGASQNKDAASGSTDKTSGSATLKAPEAPKSGLFNGFSTPQPAKTSDAEKPQGGLFSAAQPKTSSGLFSQTFQPESQKSGNLFKPQSAFSSTPQTNSSTEAPKDAAAQQSTPKEPSNPFAKLPTPTSARPNLFSAPKEPAPASPASSMPNLMGAAAPSSETSEGSELPKIPKVHVPKEWALPGVAGAQNAGGLYQHISDLTAQLQNLNERYRQQLSSLPLTADWSSVSLWHYQHASEIKKKIDNAKKQRAAAKGVTGNESALSTKRKVNDESPEIRDASPTKRARAGDAPDSPTPQPSAPTPRLNPPATSTSAMFANAIGNKSSTSSGPTNLFAPKTAEPATTSPSKPAAPVSGFTPSFSASNGTTSTSSGFKPTFGGGSTGGFKPSSGTASTGGSGGFFGQFSKTAKTYEDLAAERKAKAMAADYDSDDETEEEWSAKYDKKEAERLAEEKKKAAATPKFSIPASTKSSGNTTPTTNPFAGLAKPTNSTPTPSLFNSRVGSPAPSTGSQSVFDAPSTAQPASPNIFGHLSSGPSSNNQDESDEDEQATEKSQNDQAFGSVEPTTPKRKFGESETEDDETLEETMKRKKQETETGSKGSFLSRITKDDDNDAESKKENSSTTSVFGQTNGTQTPTNKPFQFFDFGAAGSKTAPPKSDTFAGDQTFKPGSPIKFGNGPATEKKSAAPMFQFQPATPSPAEFSTTPAKPPPSLFNFGSTTGGSSLLAPSAGLSGASSVPSSVFSSRAGTPLSEADTSAAASAGEDDEEGSKQAQVDFSQLTEEETNANDIVFHAEVVLAKHHVDKGDGTKAWAALAKGPLWILKDKATAKCFLRIRLSNGSTPLNYSILPALKATVTGSSKKMILASKPAKEGGLQQVLYAVKTPEIAEEFASKYNESLPSN